MDKLQRLSGTIVTTTIASKEIFFFVVNPDDSIAKFHYAGSFYEQEELSIIASYYRGGTFVDVGAHVGNHAIYVSKYLEPSKVVVFEPNPPAIQILRINCALNRCLDIDTRFLGIALAEREARLKAVSPDANNIGNTMFFAADDGDVQALPGDALLLHEPVDFIKLDAEGMETEILAGLRRTIARWRPIMFVEVWERKIPEFESWCEAHAYRIVDQYQRYEEIRNFLIMPL